MKDKLKDNELSAGLVHEEIDQTCTSKNSALPKARPRFKLKFTDFAIDKFVASFKHPQTGKNRTRVYIPFDVSKNTSLKGLKLCQYYEKRTKMFVLNYWFNKKSLLLIFMLLRTPRD
jgi:hypothetical protein